jgi:hypothetical protein
VHIGSSDRRRRLYATSDLLVILDSPKGAAGDGVPVCAIVRAPADDSSLGEPGSIPPGMTSTYSPAHFHAAGDNRRWARIGSTAARAVCAFLLAVLAVLVAAPGSDAATTALLKTNCAPVWLGKTAMIYNERQANGRFDVRVGARDCTGGEPLLAAHDGHRGASDVTADGRYVLLETDYGSPRGMGYAEPGKGFGNDLELLDRQTGRLTRLTTGRKGTIWARLHPSGSRVTWAEMVKTQWEANWWDNAIGIWRLHVADITPEGTLADERSWQHPTDPGFIETYGWIGDRLMFASDSGVTATNPWMGKWFATQLWTIADTLGTDARPERVSPQFVRKTWWGGDERHNAYHEFMHVAPAGTFADAGPWILTSVGWATEPYNGLDLWRMRPDGSGRERLTRFNDTRYAVVGDLVFDPLDPKRVLAHVTRDINAKAIDVYEIRIP